MTPYHESGDPIASIPAVPMRELPVCCIAAIRRGQKVITYMCDGCKTLRQFDVDRPKQYRRQDVVCQCGHQQAVQLFPT